MATPTDLPDLDKLERRLGTMASYATIALGSGAVAALVRRIRELEAERERILPMLLDIHKALDEQRIKLDLLTLTTEPVAPVVEAEEETR